MSRIIILICVLSILGSASEAARILGVFPYPSISHQMIFRRITTELSKRGHELVIFTTDPLNDPNLRNYTEVDMHYMYDRHKRIFNFAKAPDIGFWKLFKNVYIFGEIVVDETFSHPKMQKIISPNNTEQFDLILVQFLFFDALYALSIQLNTPIIGISTFSTLFTAQHYQFGNPLLSSYSPDMFLGCKDDMSFWERLQNTYYHIFQLMYYYFFNIPIQDKVLKKHFGDKMPHASELTKRISMLFVNALPSFGYPRANVPGIVEIGGLLSSSPKKKLSVELKKFVDDAKEGFIYFSLGTNVRSNQLDEVKQNIFISAFSELPYKIVWKWESENMPRKPDNVFISKWLPQREVLSHPNILLFLYQGGVQSTEEAISNGVPMIGCPFFSDQVYNLNKFESMGIAKQFDINTIDKETLKKIIVEMVTNKSVYKQNVLRVRNLINDRPIHPLEQAMWWSEYVIRHKGAPHFYTKSRELPWYKLESIDIQIFLMAILAVLSYIAYILIKRLSRIGMTIYRRMCQEKRKIQ